MKPKSNALNRLGNQVGHFINNEFRPSRSGKDFTSLNPATGEVLARVARGNREDVEEAVAAAKQAVTQGPWAQMPPAERAQIMMRIGDAIAEERQELAELESLDTGKPIQETLESDLVRAAKNFHFFAQVLRDEPEQRVYRSDDGSVHCARREPMGVCGLITPWNLPLYLATWKIAPALAMGNTVVLKPAELAPLSAAALAAICKQCDLPPGVLNIVNGFGENEAGAALVTSREVSAISFTGETTTGKSIMRAASDGLKKLSFELGGKGASVIFADANIEAALPLVLTAAYRNQGQVCLAGSRLLLHESIADHFIERLLPLVRSIKLGDPLDPTTTMGSLISRDHRDHVMNFVRVAEREGAQVLCGGEIPEQFPKLSAYFMPTLIHNVKQDSRIVQNEVFGPVLTIQTFKTLAEAVAMVNGTAYGLSCSVWSQDPQTLEKFSRGVRSGIIWQNTWFTRNLAAPFGGTKASGLGREGGTYSFDFYGQWKTVISPNAQPF